METITQTHSATRILRDCLIDRWPLVDFIVDEGAGASELTVSWKDGPTQIDVLAHAETCGFWIVTERQLSPLVLIVSCLRAKRAGEDLTTRGRDGRRRANVFAEHVRIGSITTEEQEWAERLVADARIDPARGSATIGFVAVADAVDKHFHTVESEQW